MPGSPDFLQTDLRLRSIFRTLELIYGSELTNLRVADLGCLEGGFALALAQRGAQALGIEARKINMDKLLLLQEHFGLGNLDFRLGDVKGFTRDAYGMFDVVLALGILYHLDEPVAWLRQLSETTKRVLIIDTHFAPTEADGLANLDSRLPLGDVEQIKDGPYTYEGRWFFEFGENVDPEPQLWASYSNHKSFWLTKEALVQAVQHSGFDLVYEQHDHTGMAFRRFATAFPRIMLVAARSKPVS
jgi:SAM-dependent methyltransferase